jgi:fatty-acyl-CoA synthase
MALTQALVVQKPGHGASEESIIAYCRERLAPYKVPKRVVLVDAQ